MTKKAEMPVHEPPKIAFPCEYPIRIIGHSRADFRAVVLRIVREHAPDFAEAEVTVRDSRDGAYCSVRVNIVATGEPQLRALHEALLANPSVKLVL
jgi:putative lipoic acid-binding regulatory protein